MKIAVTNYETLPADVYPAILIKIEEKETDYGPGVILHFTITDGEYAGKEISGLASATLARKSKLRGWLEGWMGKPIPDGTTEIDLDKFLNKTCRISLKVVPGKDNGEVNRIDSILPMKSAKPAPAPAPKPAEGNGGDDLF